MMQCTEEIVQTASPPSWCQRQLQVSISAGQTEEKIIILIIIFEINVRVEVMAIGITIIKMVVVDMIKTILANEVVETEVEHIRSRWECSRSIPTIESVKHVKWDVHGHRLDHRHAGQNSRNKDMSRGERGRRRGL